MQYKNGLPVWIRIFGDVKFVERELNTLDHIVSVVSRIQRGQKNLVGDSKSWY